MTDSDITNALESFAHRQLLGGRWRRVWRWLFGRKRYRATVTAIRTNALHKNVLVASVRLWLSEVRRQTEKVG